MTDSGPRKIGVSIELKPHAYDPAANPELFEGVLARRFIAFIIDVVIIAVPVMFAAIFIFMFGFVNERRRLLHDILVGTIVINKAARAAALSKAWRGG